MSGCIEHGPCVCMQIVGEECGVGKCEKTKSQEGGVCERTHTRHHTVDLSSSSSVASQSTSSRVTTRQHSTSRVLALCGGGHNV